MTEAWLLIDEAAIRKAAGNPNGRAVLRRPPLAQLERVPDPKSALKELLVTASERQGRRLDQFRRNLNWYVQRVADLVYDFAPLRQLPAFQAFERDTRAALSELLGRSWAT
jgi:hypothetical protein